MNSAAVQEPSSFRDPSGSVYLHEGRVFRTVTDARAVEFKRILGSDFVKSWMQTGKMVQTRLVAQEARCLVPKLPAGAILLEHQRIPFISYPYEWPFELLKKAALFHLDLQREALAADVAFTDASAFNIQFVGSTPILMDALSLRSYEPGEYWNGYKQFCEQFLNPLLLAADFGINHHGYYRGSLNGHSVEDTAAVYGWSALKSWRVATHVMLHASMIRKARQRASDGVTIDVAKKGRKLSKAGYQALLGGMHSWIAKLQPKGMSDTIWGSYEFDHSYDTEEEAMKTAAVAAWVTKAQPKTVWDLGCNSGAYSEVALEAGAESVIGFDIDPGALQGAVARSEAQRLHFLPLFLDATNPPAQQGWLQNERRGLLERRNADGLLALALLHHIVIGANVPLRQAVKWLIGLAPQGVIEFVPTTDPMVARMLMNRQSGVHMYDLVEFREAVAAHARIVSEEQVSSTGRRLVMYSQKSE